MGTLKQKSQGAQPPDAYAQTPYLRDLLLRGGEDRGGERSGRGRDGKRGEGVDTRPICLLVLTILATGLDVTVAVYLQAFSEA